MPSPDPARQTVRPRLLVLLALVAMAFPCAAQADDIGPEPGPSADAQTLWRLELAEAIAHALASHPSLPATRTRIAEAERSVDGSAQFAPWMFQASADYAHEDMPIRDALTRGMQIRDTFNWSVGVSKAWDWGTELVVSLTNTLARRETPLSFEVQGVEVTDRRITEPYDFSMLTLQVTHHLLRGGQRAVNQTLRRLAEAQLDAETLSHEQQVSRVVAGVVAAYWDLSRAQEEVALRRERVLHLDEQRAITEELIKAGVLAEIELDLLAQQRLVAEEGVLAAEQARQLGETGLRAAMGQPFDEGRRIVTATPVPEVLAEVDAEARLERARERAYALRALAQQLAVQDLEVARTEEALLPVLDLTARVSQLGLDDDISLDGGLMFDAYGQIATFDYGAVSAGVVFAMPLDDVRLQTEADRASLARQRIAWQLADARAQVDLQVHSLLTRLEAARAQLALSERSVALAQSNLERGNERFAAGRLTSFDVLRLQEALADATSRHAAVRVELATLEVELDDLTGALLERHGIALDPQR